MEARTEKTDENFSQSFALINNFEIPKVKGDLKNKPNNVIGLGNVDVFQYTYNDICPNAMK